MIYYNTKVIIAALFILTVISGNAFADEWGVYPDCYAPGTPLEVHSWWHEKGEEHPRHIHLAACLPNARDTTGKLVSFSGSQTFTTRVMSFNSPGTISFVRDAWKSEIASHAKTSLSCQDQVDEMAECHWWLAELEMDASLADNGGLQELRISPNVVHEDLDTRQFATLNYQIYLKNGKTERNYRSKPDPIARSWYSGFDYANVTVNYMDFFTDLKQTIPTVSGIVPLEVAHSEGSFDVTSYLFLDPDFHAHPHSHDNPAADPTGKTKLLYKKPGRFRGTYYWDTRGLTNGIHTLYFQTEDKGPAGIHAGALKLLFNVSN